MSQEAVERVLGRMLTDKHFRTQIGTSLESASRQKGLLLNPAELKLLSALELQFVVELSDRIDPCLRRAGWR